VLTCCVHTCDSEYAVCAFYVSECTLESQFQFIRLALIRKMTNSVTHTLSGWGKVSGGAGSAMDGYTRMVWSYPAVATTDILQGAVSECVLRSAHAQFRVTSSTTNTPMDRHSRVLHHLTHKFYHSFTHSLTQPVSQRSTPSGWFCAIALEFTFRNGFRFYFFSCRSHPPASGQDCTYTPHLPCHTFPPSLRP
jgi:hypothetical protein